MLDIETVPDRYAQVLAGRRDGVPPGSPLNAVANVTMLTFGEAAEGAFDGFRLRSFHQDEFEEPDILLGVDAELDAIAERGLLVTFNGRAFDLPTLDVRRIRWWLCEADAVDRIRRREDAHMDVMLELSAWGEGRWPSLADACASMGLSLHGPRAVGGQSRFPAALEKCERDVVGTAILFFHVLAARRRSVAPLRNGLPALGRFLRAVAPGRPHLERFALSELLAENAAAWGR